MSMTSLPTNNQSMLLSVQKLLLDAEFTIALVNYRYKDTSLKQSKIDINIAVNKYIESTIREI